MIRHNIKRARQEDGGFTLIELLIVIVVLGVLGGIVVFGVGTFRADSQTAANCANLETVEVASQAYIAKNGTPAPALADLVTAGLLKTAPTPAPTYTAGTGNVTMVGC